MTKSLSKAIALATALGAAASAHAVNVNTEGLGEVLLYPVYTADANNQTYINVTNTTEYAKAVKVRFVEGQNSREVLDFNLYLSPRDQWSGAVVKSENGEGAKLITADKSCTMPAIYGTDGIDFRQFNYTTGEDVINGVEVEWKKADGGNQTLERTLVGHLEIIEMGVLDANLTADVSTDHVTPGAAPANCNALLSRFTDDNGVWSERNSAADLQAGFLSGADSVDKVGGLYGSASIIDINNATQISYDAVALDNFAIDSAGEAGSKHTATGSELPSLMQVGQNLATFKNGKTIAFPNAQSTISSLFMKESISNDFVLDFDKRGSKTNWVVTFPTKRFHVDSGVSADLPPFANPWVGGQSCQEINTLAWDNEEFEGRKQTTKPGQIDFSPMPTPKPGTKKVNSLCYETNILTFNNGVVLAREAAEASADNLVSYNAPLSADYPFGWMKISFTADTSTNTVIPYALTTGVDVATGDPAVISGLPVIGFSAVTISNGKTGSGALNNYGSATVHKSETSDVISH